MKNLSRFTTFGTKFVEGAALMLNLNDVVSSG